MDWVIAVFVVPEVIVLLLGFIAIISSLVAGGELSKLMPTYKPRGREVDPTYWGQYLKEVKDSSSSMPAKPATTATAITTAGIALPNIVKAAEIPKWEKDWNGGPQS